MCYIVLAIVIHIDGIYTYTYTYTYTYIQRVYTYTNPDGKELAAAASEINQGIIKSSDAEGIILCSYTCMVWMHQWWII